MSDFAELYQEIILDHYRSPRGAARLDHIPEASIHENPTCGDSLKLEVILGEGGRLERVRFECRGCAISTASASLMTERLAGTTVDEARELAWRFIRTLRGEEPIETLEELGELVAFKGLTKFALRVKCATLAWHALLSALPPT